MYYEETVIDGVLYCKGLPESEWRPVPYKEILARMLKAEQEVAAQRSAQQTAVCDCEGEEWSLETVGMRCQVCGAIVRRR